MLRLGVALIGSAILLTTAAGADNHWATVRLGNKPDFTIDVPAVVADQYQPNAKDAAKGQLMFFAVVTKTEGDLDCLLSGTAYSKKLPYKAAVARLATSVRDVLCTGDDATYSIEESQSLTSNGYPAGRCAASHTEAGDKQPGRVVSVLAIAAPKRFYMMSCRLRTGSEDEAKLEWEVDWNDEVQHIQQSLHLPAAAK